MMTEYPEYTAEEFDVLSPTILIELGDVVYYAINVVLEPEVYYSKRLFSSVSNPFGLGTFFMFGCSLMLAKRVASHKRAGACWYYIVAVAMAH